MSEVNVPTEHRTSRYSVPMTYQRLIHVRFAMAFLMIGVGVVSQYALAIYLPDAWNWGYSLFANLLP